MSFAYIRHALNTAWRVARFDKDALGDFDQSFEGFFRSFIGIVLCAPIYLLVILAKRRMAADLSIRYPEFFTAELPKPDLAYYALESGIYVLGWLAFPLAMIGIARLIGAGPRYVPYIVAYNWLGCLVLTATVIPYLLYLVTPSALVGSLLYYPIIIVTLVYRWRIARYGLQISPMNATGIVIVDVLLSFLIAALATQILDMIAP